MIRGLFDRTVSTLGVVQIVAWGSTFYLPAVLAPRVVAETGWPASIVTGGVSVGLLVSGIAAARVGRLIGARGGRPVMAAAMALIALGLTAMAAAPGPAWWLAAWALTGLGMGAGLYDAAYATLGRLRGRDARSAITALTLWGGFASTICWPITGLLVETFGWRGACLAWAALHLVLTLPLCAFALPREASRPRPPAGTPGAGRGGVASDPRFWLLALAGTAMVTISTLWAIHLMTVLTARGLTLAAAVSVGMLIGPAQVGGRLFEMALGGRHHPAWTALAATGAVAAGFAILAAGAPAALATIVWGAGNGMWSIARGTLPLALYEVEDYPEIVGRLATPVLLASAAAPALGAAAIAAFGAQSVPLLLLVVALVPLCAIGLLGLSLIRDRSVRAGK